MRGSIHGGCFWAQLEHILVNKSRGWGVFFIYAFVVVVDTVAVSAEHNALVCFFVGTFELTVGAEFLHRAFFLFWVRMVEI